MPILNIGHRGAKGHITENTLASFARALSLGAKAIELDVHACATGELVVIHDFTVDRVTNGTGEVHKLTLAELKSLTVTGGHTIPTLDEVLAVVGKKCLINIEMKGNHIQFAVANLIERYVCQKGYTYDDFLVSSFGRVGLEFLHMANRNIKFGMITEYNLKPTLHAAGQIKPYSIHPHHSLLNEDTIKQCKDLGCKVYPWTVNEPEDIARVKALGVDGIITDYPDRI